MQEIKRGGFHPWVRKITGGGHGNPLQYSCLENPHGQRSLEGYSPQGRKEWNRTEANEHACTHWGVYFWRTEDSLLSSDSRGFKDL